MSFCPPVRFPLLRVLGAHLLSFGLVWLALPLMARLPGWPAGLLPAAVLQGGCAALLGHGLGLSRWWLAINLGFMPALAAVFWLQVPAWLPPAGLLVVLLLNWNALGERVPLYLTGRVTERRLQALLAERPAGFRFVDLGCGLAGTLARLSRQYPAARFDGVETAPLCFVLAWLRCLPYGNCRIRFQSLWRVDLGGYDVAYCFLSPVPMPALWEKARREMGPEAWLISNTFGVPGVEPRQVVEVGGWRHARLLLWQPGRTRAGDA